MPWRGHVRYWRLPLVFAAWFDAELNLGCTIQTCGFFSRENLADGGADLSLQDGGVVLELETEAMAEEADISSSRFNLSLPSAFWEGGQVELNAKY